MRTKNSLATILCSLQRRLYRVGDSPCQRGLCGAQHDQDKSPRNKPTHAPVNRTMRIAAGYTLVHSHEASNSDSATLPGQQPPGAGLAGPLGLARSGGGQGGRSRPRHHVAEEESELASFPNRPPSNHRPGRSQKTHTLYVTRILKPQPFHVHRLTQSV